MPVTPQVDVLLRERIKWMLDASATSGKFAADSGARMHLADLVVEGVEMDGESSTKPLRGASAITTIDLEVTDSEANMGGNMHGGCTAYLIDMASSLSLLCLSGDGRWPTSGVSTNLNVYYISAAPIGTKISIISKVVMQGRTVAVLESKIIERGTNRLIATATHVKQDNSRPAAKL